MIRRYFFKPWMMLVTLALIVLVAALTPLERTLGANIRLIYFHGAWVWAGKFAFAAAAAFGLAGLVIRRWDHPAARWALAAGRAGLFFWATYLPMSLLVMQLNWGGLFLDEPRFRTPLMLGIVGVLLHAGFVLLEYPSWLVEVGSLAFGVALWWALGVTANVLHPDSPVYTSDSLLIEVFFTVMTVLAVVFGAQLTAWFHRLKKA
jgi:hypothetical protein